MRSGAFRATKKGQHSTVHTIATLAMKDWRPFIDLQNVRRSSLYRQISTLGKQTSKVLFVPKNSLLLWNMFSTIFVAHSLTDLRSCRFGPHLGRAYVWCCQLDGGRDGLVRHKELLGRGFVIVGTRYCSWVRGKRLLCHSLAFVISTIDGLVVECSPVRLTLSQCLDSISSVSGYE